MDTAWTWELSDHLSLIHILKSNLRNEIKSYIVRSGYTMQEVVDRLSEDYGWSDSVSNLSNKLQRESLRYVEAVSYTHLDVYKRQEKGQTVSRIAEELKLEPAFVEEICRIKVTHPGVTALGILDKMEVNKTGR